MNGNYDRQSSGVDVEPSDVAIPKDGSPSPAVETTKIVEENDKVCHRVFRALQLNLKSFCCKFQSIKADGLHRSWLNC